MTFLYVFMCFFPKAGRQLIAQPEHFACSPLQLPRRLLAVGAARGQQAAVVPKVGELHQHRWNSRLAHSLVAEAIWFVDPDSRLLKVHAMPEETPQGLVQHPLDLHAGPRQADQSRAGEVHCEKHEQEAQSRWHMVLERQQIFERHTVRDSKVSCNRVSQVLSHCLWTQDPALLASLHALCGCRPDATSEQCAGSFHCC